MESVRMYPWEETYIAAILETDNGSLKDKIRAAEAKVAARLGELRQDHGGTPEEVEALNAAIRGLEALREERLRNTDGKA